MTKNLLTPIETGRLNLIPLNPNHATELFEPFTKSELYSYISWEVPKSSAELQNKFERMCAGRSEDGKQLWLNWIAHDKETSKPSGFYQATIEGTAATLAYYTFHPFQRKGYAKEGIGAIMAHIESVYPLRKFFLEMDTRNRASVRLAESLGFSWTATVNNACELKGFQSHEFRFEKAAGQVWRPLQEADAFAYICFRYPDKPASDQSQRAGQLLQRFSDYVSEQETVLVAWREGPRGLEGAACLLQFQPGSFGLSNLVIRNQERYEGLFVALLSKVCGEVRRRGGGRLEYRLIETEMTAVEANALEAAGFAKKYHRTEFKKQLAELDGDQDTPLRWRSLPNLSESSLQHFAQRMTQAAEGDPDFNEEDDAYECLQGYLVENDLTHGPECFHLAEVEGKEAAVVIAQVDKRTGWSRITYMGLLPEFRQRGLGKWVHRHGFQMMKEQGGTYYHGGTLTNNEPMVKLFEKHHCEKLRTMQGWVCFINS